MDTPDDDFLDGCDTDFTADPDDDLTADFRALFPDGVPDEELAEKWRALALATNAQEADDA